MKTHCRIWVTDDDGEIVSDVRKMHDHQEDDTKAEGAANAVREALVSHDSLRIWQSLAWMIYVAGDWNSIPDDEMKPGIEKMCEGADEADKASRRAIRILEARMIGGVDAQKA